MRIFSTAVLSPAFLGGVAASLVATAVQYGPALVLDEKVPLSTLYVVYSVFAGLTAFVIIRAIQNSAYPLFLKLGVSRIYRNFSVCEQEIIEHIKTSKKIKIFIQVGKSLFSSNATIADVLTSSQLRPDVELQLLHAGLTNPYLSERIAQSRKSNYDLWKLDIKHTEARLSALAIQRKLQIEQRNHKEGFIFRVFIFDDIAYIQPYFHEKGNSKKAPVISFKKLNFRGEEYQHSMYNIFERHFNNKWEENCPDRINLSQLLPSQSTHAVAARIIYDGMYLFAIPRRYIETDHSEIFFHGVGGKCADGEHPTAALTREVAEEIGVACTVTPAPTTRYLTSSANLPPIELNEKVRPYCIYKKTASTDHNFSKSEVAYLIGYDAHIESIDGASPRNECGAILILSNSLLRRAAMGELTYKTINSEKDGSRMIIAPDIAFDLSKRAIPKGLAAIIANELS